MTRERNPIRHRYADKARRGCGQRPGDAAFAKVVDIYVAEGGNEGAGFTQYSHEKKELQSRASGNAEEAEQLSDERSFRPMTIPVDGHLSLPADLRRAMMLDTNGRVTVSVVDGELRVISPMAAVRQLQRRASSLVPVGTIVSDELIAERRAEA